MKKLALSFTCVLFLASHLPVFGQQTGTITGTVTSPDGDAIPGVTVEASGDVLPQARTTVTSTSGAYRFPLLPPGTYEVTYSLSGMASQAREVRVQLRQLATGRHYRGLGGFW